MNNSISVLMIALVLAVCITFMLKGWRKPEPEKETQKAAAVGLFGLVAGFVAGLVLGATKPQLIFSDSFLKHEGGELGAIALLSIGFSVVGTFCSLLIHGYFWKRKA